MSSDRTLPRISIVTPSYNQAGYLAETIESILDQGYPNLEYMIIDGGSTDGSADIIKKYAPHLAYWTSQKDQGQSDAIGTGLSRSTGELFAWVNSDDILLPGCLNAVAQCYAEEKAPDIIHASVVYINTDGVITRFVRLPRQTHFFLNRGVWHASAPAVFFKSARIRAVGGVSREYHLSMDVDVWMRMMKAGARVGHISRYLGAVRWHDQAKTVRSLQTRQTAENTETAEIYDRNLATSTAARRFLWRRLYKCYQVLNSNYVRAHRDLKRLGGQKHWKEIFSFRP